MSEYTPKTWEIKHAYVDTTEYVQRMEKGESRSLAEVNEEFDRWLAQHDLEVARAERNRTIETLNKHHEDIMDLADRASRNADDDPVFYINEAQTVQECIERVKKQVN